MEPDDVAFCSLIRGFSSEKEVSWEDIERIVERMEKKFGVKPTISVLCIGVEGHSDGNVCVGG